MFPIVVMEQMQRVCMCRNNVCEYSVSFSGIFNL